MNRPRRSLPLLTLLLAAPALTGCGPKPDASVASKTVVVKPVTVTVAPVERRPVERTIEVVGSLRGWEDVTVGSKRTGRVIKVTKDMGDRVKPGDLIVGLDTVDADLAVARAERSLTAELGRVGLRELPTGKFDESKVPSVAQAQYALDKARQNLNRERTLRQRGAGTQQDYQNAEIDEQAATASLENAVLSVRTVLDNAQVSKVALDVARQQRADMDVRAPIPSKPPEGLAVPLTYAVAKRSAAEGQMLREGDPVAELVVENPLRLWTNVPERFSAEVVLGQEVRIAVASFPGRDFAGKVTRINPSVDAISRTFQVEAAVPNDDGKLRPGGFAKASIVVRRDDSAQTVPLESVVRNAGVVKLFVVGEGNMARSILVTTGLEGQGWIEVIGPIPPGAKVVATGQMSLAEGSAVVIREAPTLDAKPAAATAPATKAPDSAG